MSLLSSLLKSVLQFPTTPGVYTWRDKNRKIIYIGKAKNLKRRVSSYFRSKHPKVVKLIEEANFVEFTTCASDSKAYQLEQHLIAEWRPKYNQQARNPRVTYWLYFTQTTATQLSSLKISSIKPLGNCWGPYLASAAYNLCNYFEEYYGVGFEALDLHFLDDPLGFINIWTPVKAEISKFPSKISLSDYTNRINSTKELLNLSSVGLQKHIYSQMSSLASIKKFEEAALLRDLYFSLKQTAKLRLRVPAASTPLSKTSELQKALNIQESILTMDCFDISHISGTLVVASCVRFKNGLPDKNKYRKLKISIDTNDDFKAMKEAVYRRYKKGDIPSLIIIDGGEGQLSAALKAFYLLKVRPKHIIGLEKQFEQIVFADKRPPLSLGAYHNGLKLLQNIRDEAHRFANKYHADLRSKLATTSVFESLNGIGKVTALKLAESVHSLSDLKTKDTVLLAKQTGLSVRLLTKIKSQIP